MKEIWKDIDGYEGMYQISNLGRVKSLERKDRMGRLVKEKIIKPKDDKDGYKRLILYKDGKGKNYRIHRLVATTFIPNPENKPQVNHKDCNVSNNNVDNLEWVISLENNNHGDHNKKISKAKRNHKSVSKAVMGVNLTNGLILIYPSVSEAGRNNLFQEQNISTSCRNEKRTHKGYKWYYLEEE